jgi:hypothetical protein
MANVIEEQVQKCKKYNKKLSTTGITLNLVVLCYWYIWY